MSKQANDVFADIAQQRIIYRDQSLVEPAPAELPDVTIPLETCDQNAVFEKSDKIDSAEKLSVELENMRKKYAGFMANYAPEISSLRTRKYVSQFNWRIETEEDKSDFLNVLSGLGEWEMVQVPHYGEPLGLAVTYYRTQVEITEEMLKDKALFVHFNGVDYKAHLFLNNSYIGSHEGFFSPFEFDVTEHAKVGRNTLVVKVENDFICGGNQSWNGSYAGDKIYAATGLGYDEPFYGWHHCPPGMGIYQEVYIESRSRVFINDIFVRPLTDRSTAEAWIEVDSRDLENKEITFELSLYGQNFKQTVFENEIHHPSGMNVSGLNDDLNIALAKANGTHNKPVQLKLERGVSYFKLPISIPDFKYWDTETPWLYQLQVKVLDSENNVLDIDKKHFGMRSFTMDETSETKGFMYLNNKPIRLRGANTMGHEQQCVFKKDWKQLIDDILLAKICNMNFLRLTQRPVQEEIYDYCDMLGLMTQSDLPTFAVISRNQYTEALRQVGEVERLVRSHPCNIMISYINEPLPNAGNKPHRHLTRDELSDLFKAADDIVKNLNPERVIKPCDGDYDPPAPGIQDRHCYTTWYNGQGLDIGKLVKGFWQPTKKNWYYGCGEFGAEALECKDLMQRHYPSNWLPTNETEEKDWSPNQIFKAQTGMFHYFFFDTRHSVQDWIDASQAHQELSLKMLAEAFRRDNRMVTFAVHLFIDAFPSGWMKTIMDFERRPKKGYFAYRNALAPILASIRSDRDKFFSGEKIKLETYICNDLPEAKTGMTMNCVVKCDGKVLYAQSRPAVIEACKSTFQGFVEFDLPTAEKRTSYTFELGVVDAAGNVVNDNTFNFEVFPKVQSEIKFNVCIIGENGRAQQLANDYNLNNCSIADADIILIDSIEEYKRLENEINGAIQAGATAIFLEIQEQGVFKIAGSDVDFCMSRFNPLHFASRDTGSKLVEGLKEFDFRYWYSPKTDRIEAIIETTFTADDFTPILTAGNADKKARWCKVLAAGSKEYGKGEVCICQVALAGRTSTNPVADIFASRLLKKEHKLTHVTQGAMSFVD